MVPFSPDRPSAAPANGDQKEPTSGATGTAAATTEIAHVAASSPGVSSMAGGGGGSSSEVKEFCFSEDDDTVGEELRDHGRETIKPSGDGSGAVVDSGQAENAQGDGNPTGAAAGGGTDSITKSARVGGREEEEEQKQAHPRRRRRQRTKDGGSGDGSEDLSSASDSDSNYGGRNGSAAEQKRRQDHVEALLNPLGLPHGGLNEGDDSDGNRTPSTGPKRRVVDSACATPAPGLWAAPDFGFSSDDDFDIELSVSEKSLERSVERSWSKSPNIEEDFG